MRFRVLCGYGFGGAVAGLVKAKMTCNRLRQFPRFGQSQADAASRAEHVVASQVGCQRSWPCGKVSKPRTCLSVPLSIGQIEQGLRETNAVICLGSIARSPVVPFYLLLGEGPPSKLKGTLIPTSLLGPRLAHFRNQQIFRDPRLLLLRKARARHLERWPERGHPFSSTEFLTTLMRRLAWAAAGKVAAVLQRCVEPECDRSKAWQSCDSWLYKARRASITLLVTFNHPLGTALQPRH